MDWSSTAGVVLGVLAFLVLATLLGIAIYLLVKLLRLFSVVRSEAMPVAGKLSFWAALAYTVFPVDVLLDPVYLDDIGVLSGALAFVTHLATKHGINRDGSTAADHDGPVADELDPVAAPRRVLPPSARPT